MRVLGGYVSKQRKMSEDALMAKLDRDSIKFDKEAALADLILESKVSATRENNVAADRKRNNLQFSNQEFLQQAAEMDAQLQAQINAAREETAAAERALLAVKQDQVETADATDLASALVLINELKAIINAMNE